MSEPEKGAKGPRRKRDRVAYTGPHTPKYDEGTKNGDPVPRLGASSTQRARAAANISNGPKKEKTQTPRLGVTT